MLLRREKRKENHLKNCLMLMLSGNFVFVNFKPLHGEVLLLRAFIIAFVGGGGGRGIIVPVILSKIESWTK